MYDYSTIRSIYNSGSKNLNHDSEIASKSLYTYGIIYDYSTPRPTKAGGLSFTVSIVDESCLQNKQFTTKIEIVLPVLIFLNISKSDPSSSSSTVSLPPTPKYIGQIIRLHRFRLENFNNTLQGQGSYYTHSKHNAKPFDYVILENSLSEADADAEEDVEAFFYHKTFTEYDRKRIRELQKFAKQFIQNECCSLLRGDYFLKFDQIQPMSEKFDVICKLLSYQAYDGENKYIMELFDGTTFHATNQEVYIILFTIQQPYLIEALKRIEKGSYLRLRNIKTLSDMRLVSEDKTSIVVLPKEHVNTFWIDLMYKKIIGKGNNLSAMKQQLQLPTSSMTTEDRSMTSAVNQFRFFLTKTLFDGVKEYCTLQQVKQCKEVPMKYKVRVKFVDYEPKNVLDSLYTLCPHCQTRVPLSSEEQSQTCEHCSREYEIPIYKWVFQFMIQDSQKDVLPVYVNNSEFFFQAVPSPASDTVNWEKLKNQLQTLISAGNPFVDLCIFSYLNSSSQVSYQIFSSFLSPVK